MRYYSINKSEPRENMAKHRGYYSAFNLFSKIKNDFNKCDYRCLEIGSKQGVQKKSYGFKTIIYIYEIG